MFKNKLDGYEIRNKYFKGSLGAKDISFIQNEASSTSLCVFERFMDFLSLLAYCQLAIPPTNILVLNSLSMIDQELKLIKTHQKTYLFLDNDDHFVSLRFVELYLL